MIQTFTHVRCFTVGLVAFGWNGSTDHVASRPEILRALRVAENSDTGWADCGGVTLHEDHLRTLLITLGSDRT